METFGIIGCVFGVFGIIGFSYSMNALKRLDELEAKVSKLIDNTGD